MLQAAQIAEDDFLMITRVSREAVGLSQAFIGNSPSGSGTSNSIIGAYPSQAEDTMRRYAPSSGLSTNGSASTHTGKKRGRRFFACHGCGGHHPWTEFKNGEHIVVCPNRDNQGIRENAKKNVERMKANRQKRARQNTKRKNLGTANFADFDTAGQDCIREQVLLTLKHGNREISDTTSVASSVTTPSSVIPAASRGQGQGGSAGGRGRIFIVDVTVLAAAPALKPMMPITIHSNRPISSCSLDQFSTAPTALPFVVLSIRAPPYPLGTFTTSHLWQNAFRIVSRRYLPPRIMRQSCCRVSSSPSSKKPSPPSWRWASNSTSPTRQPKGRTHLSWSQRVPTSPSTLSLACRSCRARG